MLPLPPPFCGGPEILTSSAPLRTPSTLVFLPGGLCAISAAQSSLLHICIFPGTVQSLRPTQTSFLKLILAPRASTRFLCTGFTAWGSSDLAGKLALVLFSYSLWGLGSHSIRLVPRRRREPWGPSFRRHLWVRAGVRLRLPPLHGEPLHHLLGPCLDNRGFMGGTDPFGLPLSHPTQTAGFLIKIRKAWN